MIKYSLVCKNCDLSFESWFASSKEYEKLNLLGSQIAPCTPLVDVLCLFLDDRKWCTGVPVHPGPHLLRPSSGG